MARLARVPNRSSRPLHDRLQLLLREAWRSKTITQEALGQAIGLSQTSIGHYLRPGGKAGPLDLDQADAALRHIGSSLGEFVEGVPPRTLTRAERLASDLQSHPDVLELVEALLTVPQPQQPDVVALIRGLVLPAIGRRAGQTAGLPNGPKRARHTIKGRGLHR